MNGLSEKEAQKLASEGKINQSAAPVTRTYREIIRGNTLTYFNILNLVLFLLVLISGQYKNGLFVLTILFNTLIGIIQECKAKKMLDSLSILIIQDVDVCRDGQWKTIKADRLVLHDRIRLKAGMQIPADASIVSGYLEVNEAILTGESKTLIKREKDTLLAGASVTSGEAEADVIHVGRDNFSETILKDAKKYKRAKSMLQEDMQKLLGIISVIIVPTGIVLFLFQKFNMKMTYSDAIVKTVAAVVGMIPEGLVVLTSVALAVSVIRLSQDKILVQDLYSIESLARVDVLCLDKTGTLTQGTMKVQELIPLEDADENHIRSIMGSYVRVFREGNATDQALKDYFKENENYESTSVLPFSSERKYAAVSFRDEGSFYLGAFQFLFPKGYKGISALLENYAAEGSRVVILAHSLEPETAPEKELPTDLEPIALIVIHDLLRPNVQEIVKYFSEQGVQLKVISGDDPKTVSAISRKAGIKNSEHYADMSKSQFQNISRLAENCTVFGRVLPEQKKALLTSLQKNGHTVAMIGDGVNDVPALKTADVSIAMAAGSSAAKNSANIVLLNSDFGKMPDIVKEGRRVINNISRASSMYLVKTVFSLLLSVYVILLQRPYPFLPIHLSMISAFGVGIPTFFLQMEPNFERVKGSFFEKAFRNAVPSSITVLLTAIVCLGLEKYAGLTQGGYYTVLVILTCYVYLYTLWRIYYPPDRFRNIVLISMAAGMTLFLILFHTLLELEFQWQCLILLIPGVIVIPVVIAALSRVYDWMEDIIHRISAFFRRKKSA